MNSVPSLLIVKSAELGVAPSGIGRNEMKRIRPSAKTVGSTAAPVPNVSRRGSASADCAYKAGGVSVFHRSADFGTGELKTKSPLAMMAGSIAPPDIVVTA